MRLFEKLKSTFGKKTKNQLEIENAPLVDSEILKGEEENGLVNYDTNFIPLPKYASLPEKLKKVVDQYIQEIDPEDYETLIRYEESLQKRAKRLTEILIKVLEKSVEGSPEQFLMVSSDDATKSYSYMIGAMILKQELRLCKQEVAKLNDEALLRAIAIDRYAKKESLRKFDFLGVFGRAERLRYVRHQQSLKEAVQRSMITLAVIKNQLHSIANTIVSMDVKKDSFSKYIKSFEKGGHRGEAEYKFLKDLKEKYLTYITYCYDTSKPPFSTSLEILKQALKEMKGEWRNSNHELEAKDKVKELEETYTRCLAMLQMFLHVYVQDHDYEKERLKLEKDLLDIISEKNFYSTVFMENMEVFKESLFQFQRRMAALYRVVAGIKDSSEGLEHTLSYYEKLIYPIMNIETLSFIEKDINEGLYGGEYGIQLSKESIEHILKKFFEEAIDKIHHIYGITLNDNVIPHTLEGLNKIYDNEWSVFNAILEDKVLDIPIVQLKKSNIAQGTVCQVTLPNSGNIRYPTSGYQIGNIPLIRPVGFVLDETLCQEKISLFTLMEYLEWEEFIVHRYGPVRKDDIITILVNACSDLYIGDKGKALLALIAYEALDKRFSFSKEWSLIEMQSQTETAFFPRLLCGLENHGKGDFLVFVPIRYFNKRTKKLLIHEHFETDGTDLSNVLQYIPNVEEN